MSNKELILAIDEASQAISKLGVVARDKQRQLSEALSNSGEYSQFEDHMHYVANGAKRFTYEELASSLARRAARVGATQTLQELHDYLAADELHFERTLLLHNIQIDAEFSFSNGVHLIGIDSLPPSSVRNELVKRRLDYFVGGHVDTVLSTSFVHEKLIVSSPSENVSFPALSLLVQRDRELNDTRLLLSAARPPDYGIPVIAAVTIVPDKLAFLVNGIGYNPYPEPRTEFGPQILQVETKLADQLLQAFNRLNEDTKEGLLFALQRLNDTKIDPNWANKAINLRICLENLFLKNSETNQITRRLAERVPDHTSFSKTRTKNVYSFLSRAVHTGEAQQHPTITEEEIATEVQKVICAFIFAGTYPNWSDLPRGLVQKILDKLGFR